MKTLSAYVIAAALLASQPVFAQDHDHAAHAAQGAVAKSSGMQGGGMQGMQSGSMMMQHGEMMQGMQGMHMMPATVTAIDSKTGLVDVASGSMALKLHFTPRSLAGVKVGDKISVHLGFRKS